MEVSKYKEYVLATGLVIITSFTWLASSCSPSTTNPVTVELPKKDNTTTDKSTTLAPSESPIITLPPTTAETAPPSNLVLTPSSPTVAPPPSTITPSVYDVDINTYSIAVTGMVNRPLSLSYEQIISYAAVTQTVEIVCPDTEDEFHDWTGVSVSTLLKEAGLVPGSSEVVFTGLDGFYVQLPVEFVLQDGIFLAYQMDGQILSRDRGYPVRLVVKGSLGAKWLRWVTKIEVKPALVSFSNYSAIIRNLRSNIPTAGNKLCSCLLVRVGGLSKPVTPKPL
jgi:DMSO/TMAO reductase YedYZ molybdopterin-dependent catalytic subunit